MRETLKTLLWCRKRIHDNRLGEIKELETVYWLKHTAVIDYLVNKGKINF